MANFVDVSEMIGYTFSEIKDTIDEIVFVSENGTVFRMYHEQDCCESVKIDDIVGDLSDLKGSPIIMAEEVGGESGKDEFFESYTWTFYKIATNKGSVTIRWYGSSNGYYSESVDITKE